MTKVELNDVKHFKNNGGISLYNVVPTRNKLLIKAERSIDKFLLAKGKDEYVEAKYTIVGLGENVVNNKVNKLEINDVVTISGNPFEKLENISDNTYLKTKALYANLKEEELLASIEESKEVVVTDFYLVDDYMISSVIL